jgi:hypothetical protein
VLLSVLSMLAEPNIESGADIEVSLLFTLFVPLPSFHFNMREGVTII